MWNTLKPYEHELKDLFIYESSCYVKCICFKSVCTTVAWVTSRWAKKFVDEVRSTVFHRNLGSVPAVVYTITKAYRPGNFTIFHWRMSTIQPTWEVCTTSECWHTRCWHFCSCSSHKTIPSLKEFSVAEFCMNGCFVTALSIGIT